MKKWEFMADWPCILISPNMSKSKEIERIINPILYSDRNFLQYMLALPPIG